MSCLFSAPTSMLRRRQRQLIALTNRSCPKTGPAVSKWLSNRIRTAVLKYVSPHVAFSRLLSGKNGHARKLEIILYLAFDLDIGIHVFEVALYRIIRERRGEHQRLASAVHTVEN
jgi:hypothetical protein